MLRTLLTRIWIPYSVIHSAKTPFGLPDMPGTHQNVLIDEELRRKLLTNFAVTVADKQTLRQQFFEELLLTNLKSWIGTKLTIYEDSIYNGKLSGVTKEKILFREKEISVSKITYMKQARVLSFFQKLFKKWNIKKTETS